MTRRFFHGVLFSLFIFTHILATSLEAQVINVDASGLVVKPEITLSPRTGSFVEGSTFDVSVLLNTKGISINGLEIRISYDKNALEVVRPAGTESIIGVWVEPPKYDNSKGVASYVGVVTGGINTGSGLIGTLTFKTKRIGRASISIDTNSKIFLNNGLGSEAYPELGRGDYSILAKPPEGVRIFSETHPLQSNWYNNNSPSLTWEKDAGVSGFSFVLDNKPLTVPESKIITEDITTAYENLADGLWYFHIKANKNGAWGNAGHFLMRIDTKVPAEFNPEINYIMASATLIERVLLSFITTDSLSGVKHYEVGVIDEDEPTNVSPVFVEAVSPFQLPINGLGRFNVVVRAVDNAGNVYDAISHIEPPSFLKNFIKSNLFLVLLIIILVALTGFITSYFIGHHVVRHFKRAMQLMRREELVEESKISDNTNKTEEPHV